MKYLVSGTTSGLGRYLHDHFGGLPWDRATTDRPNCDIERYGVDTIIHCAWNHTRHIHNHALASYLSDTLFLTRRLLAVPHSRFIFISTVDVYPKDGTAWTEDRPIDANTVQGLHGITKLMAESVVQQFGNGVLILRCSTLLGDTSRMNSVRTIIETQHPTIGLTEDSRLNCVLHQDVASLIRQAVHDGLLGVLNVASSEPIKIGDIGKIFDKHITFGNYRYDVGCVDNARLTRVAPIFLKTSRQVLEEYGHQKLSLPKCI